jgi:hypothetical protein
MRGRNQLFVLELDVPARFPASLEAKMRKGLERGEFEVWLM